MPETFPKFEAEDGKKSSGISLRGLNVHNF